MCFHDGVGVKKNFEKALKHYRLALEEDPYAQYCLGLCYRDGDGVNKNKRLALLWLKKAASNGEQDAIKVLEKFSKV
jgi:TPR repeat protein